MKVQIYSDGSGTVANLPGGWGYVVVVDGVKIHEANGSLSKATNNRAELTAAIEGLKFVQSDPVYSQADVELISDSMLVLGYANGDYELKAMHLLDVYNAVRKLYKSMKVTTRWVKGHNGDEHNERCDVLAKSARESLLKKTP